MEPSDNFASQTSSLPAGVQDITRQRQALLEFPTHRNFTFKIKAWAQIVSLASYITVPLPSGQKESRSRLTGGAGAINESRPQKPTEVRGAPSTAPSSECCGKKSTKYHPLE
nr:uncharacterized protein LOC100939185 isoform X3 [Pongo abelii]